MEEPQAAAAALAPDEARRTITGLAERSGANAHLYTGLAYNETQVRREFIDPFLEALGWGVANKTNAYRVFKDVVHEDALKVAGSSRAPDYSFRMGGQRALSVEAKKPAVVLKADTAPAHQLRRYAWSAGLPVSILTDFEELAVCDTRHKPDQKDDAAFRPPAGHHAPSGERASGSGGSRQLARSLESDAQQQERSGQMEACDDARTR